MTQPVTGKHSQKMYKCSGCGTEEKHGTNHWGAIYPYCQKCCQVTIWQCLEPVPDGYGIPEPWRLVTLDEVVKLR